MPTSATSKTKKRRPTEAQVVARDMAAMNPENLESWWDSAEDEWKRTAFARSDEGKKARRAAKERARKAAQRGMKVDLTGLIKPLEEWDDEELARGRPRNSAGTFLGPAPSHVSRAVHEEAIRRFTDIVQSDMRAIVPEALRTIQWVMTCDETDDRGKPLVAAGTKLTAAQWVVEHLVGKPTQRMEADISVKLQGLLANVMVSPDGVSPGAPLMLAQSAPEDDLDAESWEDDDDSE